MAPKREENTPVKLVKEAFQDPGKAEVQVPGQLTGPVSASASYWSAYYTSATLRATAASSDLHTLQPAVKVSGRPVKGSDLNSLCVQ